MLAGPHWQSLSQGALLGYENDDWLGAIALHYAAHDALLSAQAPWMHATSLWPHGWNTLPSDGGNVLEFLLSGLLRALGLNHPLSWTPLVILPLNLLAFVPLGRHLWGRWLPTLCAAFTWTLLAPTLSELATGRMTQALLFALPLTVLALLRLETGGRRNAVLLGACGALLALSYWFYAAMLVLCLPVFVLPVRQRGQALLTELALAAAVSAVLTAPWWGTLIWTGLPQDSSGGLDAAVLSPVYSDVLALNGQWPSTLRGWLPAILVPGVLLSLVKGRRRGLWIGTLLLCWTMALGPAQDLGARVWRLPAYPFWRWVPGGDLFHHPDRWMHVGGLFLVILAFDGVARIKPALALLGPPLLLAQSLALGWAPQQTWTPAPPVVWQALDARPETGALLVVPILQSPLVAAWQHQHGRPLVGGVIEAQPWFIDPIHLDWLGRSPLVVSLWRQRGRAAPEVLWRAADQQLLSQAGVDSVVLDEAAWRKAHGHPSTRTRDAIRAALGAPVFQDSSGAIWVLPGSAPPGPRLDPPVDLRISGPAGPPPGAPAQAPR